MKRLCLITVAGALGLGVLAGAGPSAPRPVSKRPAGLYARALERAIERAQTEVWSNVELWEDHTTWENAWQIETAHYRVRTIASYNLGLQVAQGLETMFGHFQNVLQTDWQPAGRLQVDIHPNLAAYNQAGGNFDEHSSMYGSFYAAGAPGDPVCVLYDRNLTLLHMFATHSALHQFLQGAFPGGHPLWLTEGLASYFALYWAPDYGAEELARLIDGGAYVPINRVLASPSLAPWVGNAGTLFTELGMLFTYLLHYREDTRIGSNEAPFVDYVRALLTNDRNTPNLPFFELLTGRGEELEEGFRTCKFGS